MNDAELAKVYAPWGSWSKKKRDKVWDEYFQFSIREDETPQFKELERRCTAVTKERFLRKVPKELLAGNHIGLTSLLDSMDYDTGYFEKTPEEEGKEFCLELWNRAGTAIMASLDSRNPLVALFTLRLLEPIVERVGMAVTKLQKSNKTTAWLTWMFTPGSNKQVVDVPPMQHSCYQMLNHMMFITPKHFLERLIAAKTIQAMTIALEQCCPSVLNVLCPVLERLSVASAEHYGGGQALRKADTPQVAHLKTLFQKINQVACFRLLATDVRIVSVPANGPGMVETSQIVAPLCALLRTIAIDFGLTIPMHVRNHVKPFGDRYTPREPTDPVERSKWSDYYVAMRVNEEDWTVTDASEERRMMALQYTILDQGRGNHMQCAKCGKQEQGAELSRCSKCKLVYYCSRDCQVSDWKRHKKSCLRVSKKAYPERFVASFDEQIAASHARATRGGSTQYPILFAVWLDWKFNETQT